MKKIKELLRFEVIDLQVSMKYELVPAFLIFSILIISLSCDNDMDKDLCGKYEEEYYHESNDTIQFDELENIHNKFLKSNELKEIKGNDFETYRLIWYSAFGNGKAITFQKRYVSYKLTVESLGEYNEYLECEEYELAIEKEEWEKFERMIYEFDYWTADRYRNRIVADGFMYVLEGNRPDAKFCDKRSYNLVFRWSPKFDKIGSLCENILVLSSLLD